MESTDVLKTVLNVHLVSDSSAVLHLPYVLEVLSAEYLLPSSHLSKWTSRISSLLHSKDTGGRWAGFCLAHRTSILSKSVMIESGQGWLGVALPILSKKEPIPILRAAVILCRAIFTCATDTPEFQRQVSTPNVPKFTTALAALLEKDSDVEFKVLLLETLAHLVPLYPNVYRAFHSTLTSIVTLILVESSSNQFLVKAASKLYSVLHYTGGKVGAANLWRKSVDETLVAIRDAFHSLRTTFPDERGRIPGLSTQESPAVFIATGLERLRSFILVLCNLLKSTTQRPVNIPFGPIAKLAIALATVTKSEQTDAQVESNVRVMETLIVPSIWKVACELIICLTKCSRHHLTPYLKILTSSIVYHLEQKLPSVQRALFLETLLTLLTHCYPIHDPILSTRLTKAIIPFISILLPSQSDLNGNSDKAGIAGKGKKGKKKSRAYEGDEVFNTSMEVICPTDDDARALLIACDVIRLLLQDPDVSPPVHSVASRTILSALLYLSQTTPGLISPDLQVYASLTSKIQSIAMELGAGTTTSMSKSFTLVVRAASAVGLDVASRHDLDILLHPRLPPLLRSLPAVEALALFRSEESNEEAQIKESLGLALPQTNMAVLQREKDDATMTDAIPITQPQSISITSTLSLPRSTPTPQPVKTIDPTASILQMEEPQNQDAPKLASYVVPVITVPMGTSVTSGPSSTSVSSSTYSQGVGAGTSTGTSMQVDIGISDTINADGDEEIPSIDIDSDSDSE